MAWLHVVSGSLMSASPEARALFRERGIVLLKGALDRRVVGPIRQHVVDELKRLKIWSSGKSLSSALKATPMFQQTGKLSQLIRCAEIPSALSSPGVIAAVRAVSGLALGPSHAAPQCQLLLSPPHQCDWTLAGMSWHTDLASAAPARTTGVQVFALIDDVAPRGGATLAIAGTHLLPARSDANRALRDLLRTGDDLEGELRARGLEVVEMAGRAGDVYLMDMRVLHAPSINATRNVRMMATARFLSG